VTGSTTLVFPRMSPARLLLGTVLAGLVCAALAVTTSWLGGWLFGASGGPVPARTLLRGVLVVLVPGGMAGVLAVRSHVNFDTRRGVFWTIIGVLGFMSAGVAFGPAMQVESAASLLGWVGGWLASTLLVGAPLGWWAGRL